MASKGLFAFADRPRGVRSSALATGWRVLGHRYGATDQGAYIRCNVATGRDSSKIVSQVRSTPAYKQQDRWGVGGEAVGYATGEGWAGVVVVEVLEPRGL